MVWIFGWVVDLVMGIFRCDDDGVYYWEMVEILDMGDVL